DHGYGHAVGSEVVSQEPDQHAALPEAGGPPHRRAQNVSPLGIAGRLFQSPLPECTVFPGSYLTNLLFPSAYAVCPSMERSRTVRPTIRSGRNRAPGGGVSDACMAPPAGALVPPSELQV